VTDPGIQAFAARLQGPGATRVRSRSTFYGLQAIWSAECWCVLEGL
jgi:hypothetical protein